MCIRDSCSLVSCAIFGRMQPKTGTTTSSIMNTTKSRQGTVSYTHLDVYKRQELKGVKLKDYAGTKRKFEHGLWDVDAQMHVSDVIFSGRDYNEIIGNSPKKYLQHQAHI